MKILYIGQLNLGGTCLDRMSSLRRIGHEVFGFNVSDFQLKNRILASIQGRLKPRFLLNALNHSLIEFARENDSIDLIWVDKGIWIFPETLLEMKAILNAKAVHFTPDPQIIFHKSKYFLESITLYDYLVTTKSFEVDLYKQFGARHLILSQQSYCRGRYLKPKIDFRFECDIGFIGHYEKHYGNCISSALNATHNIKVYGATWIRDGWRHSGIKKVVQGTGAWSEDYVNALASFKIGLGLLSKFIPEQHTTRTFEIPAARTFMLAERTQEHMSFFEEGVEAEYFSTNEELVDKAKFYLANDVARKKIAQAGHKRCINSGYDNDSIMANILKEVNYA